MKPTTDDWMAVKALFEAALECAPDARARLLADADVSPAVRDEVRGLIAASVSAQALEEGAAAWAGPLFAANSSDDGGAREVGPYRLLRRLGVGGMGVVWLAERADGLYQRHVAVKFLRMALASHRSGERFDRERHLLARLRHPQIAELLDGGVTAEGTPYLVMAYVDGLPLPEYVARGGLDLRARLHLVRELCRPVAYAHRQLVVHRDIKPANVLVTAAGTPVLVDFGIAKVLEATDGPAASQTEIALTPAYAAPEQRCGGDITAATDVYQLGLVALELLGGNPVHTLRTTDHQLTTTRPSRVAATAGRSVDERALRGEIDWVVERALAEDPQRRYRDAESLGEDLDALLEGRPVAARPTSRWYRGRKWIARNRLASAMLAFAVLSLVAGALVAGVLAVRARREADTALAVQNFLQSVFTSAIPDHNGGSHPTSLDMANTIFDRLERELPDQPLARANLYLGLAGMYSSAGDSSRQLQASEHAVTLLERNAPDSPRLMTAWQQRVYGYVYLDRLEEAQREVDRICGLPMYDDRQRTHCVMHRYGLARTFGDPERALRIIVDNEQLLSTLVGPLWHSVRHARVLRRHATAARFLKDGAEAHRDDNLSRTDAVLLASAALPLLEAAGARDYAAQLAPRVAAEQRVLWGAGGNHASDFAVDRVRMLQLAGDYVGARAAAADIALPEPVRRIDVEPLLVRAYVELNDGDRATAQRYFEAVRRALDGRTGPDDPRLWLARAGLGCLAALEGNADADAALHGLLAHVPVPDFDEYASLARSPCPALASSAVAQRPAPEAPPDAAAIIAPLERRVVHDFGRCPDGTVVAEGSACPVRETPANLR